MEVIGSVFTVGAIPLFIIGCLVWLFFKVKTQQRKIYDLEASVRDLENRFSWLRARENSTGRTGFRAHKSFGTLLRGRSDKPIARPARDLARSPERVVLA